MVRTRVVRIGVASALAAGLVLPALWVPEDRAAAEDASVADAADRVVTTVAGTGEEGPPADSGPALQARLGPASSVAAGSDGTVFVGMGSQIFAIDEDETMTLVAGTGKNGFSGDGGPATEAELHPDEYTQDLGLDVGPDGTVYVADAVNHRVRAIDQDGTIRTIAGSGPPGDRGEFAGDGGPATEAALYNPSDVAVDADGTVYIADYYNYRIRTVTPDGTISTVAGMPNPSDEGSGFFPTPQDGGSGVATEAFVEPHAIATGPDGLVYVAEDDAVRAVDPDADTITPVMGSGSSIDVHLERPSGMAVDGEGTVYLTDGETHAVHVADLDDEDLTTWGHDEDGEHVQDGTSIGDGGPVAEADFAQPGDVSVGPDGTVYVADEAHHRIRAISPTADDQSPGRDGDEDGASQQAFGAADIATVVGGGAVEDQTSADTGIEEPVEEEPRQVEPGAWFGTAPTGGEVHLDDPSGVAIGPDQTLYVADSGHDQIRAVDPEDGTVRLIAGLADPEADPEANLGADEDDEGEDEVGASEPATEVALSSPSGLAIGPNANVLYVADNGTEIGDSGRIQAVNLDDGTIETVLEHVLNNPGDVDVDDEGTVYVADTGNNRVCRIADRNCASVVGAEDEDAAVDEVVGSALVNPRGVAVADDGTIYIADTGSARVRAYDPREESVTLVAGNGLLGLPQDGANALTAEIGVPEAVHVAEDGTVYIADVGNHRVHAVDPDDQTIHTVAGSGVGTFGDHPAAQYSNAPQLDDQPMPWLEDGGFVGDDGPAVDAELMRPSSLVIADDALYVADAGNDRVRAVGEGIEPPEPADRGISTWAIAGVAGAGVAALALAMVWFWRRRRGRAPEDLQSAAAGR